MSWIKRPWHRLMGHGPAPVVMNDRFCVGWRCSCGEYFWRSKY